MSSDLWILASKPADDFGCVIHPISQMYSPEKKTFCIDTDNAFNFFRPRSIKYFRKKVESDEGAPLLNGVGQPEPNECDNPLSSMCLGCDSLCHWCHACENVCVQKVQFREVYRAEWVPQADGTLEMSIVNSIRKHGAIFFGKHLAYYLRCSARDPAVKTTLLSNCESFLKERS